MKHPIATFVTILLASCGGEPALEAAPPWDVVVVMLDTTRADHLGPFQLRDQGPTPFLSRLAKDAIVFQNAWTAATVTAPSTASVLTGLVPPRHGLEYNLMAQHGAVPEGQTMRDYLTSVDMVALPRGAQTLAELLSAAGYQTLGIGANPNFCDEFGFDRGFDVFSESDTRDAEAMAKELETCLRGMDPNAPTFTYLHFMDPHSPYRRHTEYCSHPPDERCTRHCRYRSEIAYLDAWLERIFSAQGYADNCLVVVVTDHGEEFHDHGDILHRNSVHQELARCGLMIRVPGQGGRRTRIPAHHTDVVPTILDALDLPRPQGLDGISLLEALQDSDGGQTNIRPLLTVRASGKGELRALTAGTWRLIADSSGSPSRLYDLEADPTEQHDLAAQEPERLRSLEEELANLRESLIPLDFEHVSVDMTQAMNEKLQALGYGGGDD